MLSDNGHCINSEAIDSAVKPKAQHAVEVINDVFIEPIEIWLPRRERMQIPLPRCSIWFGNARPRTSTKNCFPIVRRQFTVDTLAITKPKSFALFTSTPSSDCFCKPSMLITAVIWNHIHQDA